MFYGFYDYGVFDFSGVNFDFPLAFFLVMLVSIL